MILTLYFFAQRLNKKYLINYFKPRLKLSPLISSQSLILISGVIAGLSIAPNNRDSMTYHLPRYLHWFNNKNLDFFTTTNLR